jgi:Uma2 family endonuclease
MMTPLQRGHRVCGRAEWTNPFRRAYPLAMALTVPLYTVDDLARFPQDGNRYELLDGVLLVTPAPAAVHQLVASRIQVRLATTLDQQAHVVGPGAIVRRPRTQLEPDVLVYPSRFSPRDDWPKITEHWLAVEVLSRASRVYDREFKRDAYVALGVREVWLVDWRARLVEMSQAPGDLRMARDAIQWLSPAGVLVDVDLNQIFAGIDQE